MTPINFYNEDGKWVARNWYRVGFTTTEVVARCKTLAKVNQTYITAVRPDGFSCGFHGPED